MAEATSSDKFAQVRFERDGYVYARVDGGEKLVGTVAEARAAEAARLLASIAESRAEQSALLVETMKVDGELAEGPALLAQALARIFGLDPNAGMAAGVPGADPGQPMQMSAAGGGYAQNYGPESF